MLFNHDDYILLINDKSIEKSQLYKSHLDLKALGVIFYLSKYRNARLKWWFQKKEKKRKIPKIMETLKKKKNFEGSFKKN